MAPVPFGSTWKDVIYYATQEEEGSRDWETSESEQEWPAWKTYLYKEMMAYLQ